MKFKKEPPTESGYYWVVDSDWEPKIVYLNRTTDCIHCMYGYTHELDEKYVKVFTMWGDKIEIPTQGE